MVGTGIGYALQSVALFFAPVMLVQPLIVTEMLFALPLAREHRNPGGDGDSARPFPRAEPHSGQPFRLSL